jgi:putative transcriptional regulator
VSRDGGEPMTASARLLSMAALLAIMVFVGVSTDAARQLDRDPSEISVAGRLLVATPDLKDPNFRQTVVYMIHHDDDGAMGLVINRVLGAGPLDKLLQGLGIASRGGGDVEIEIHYGGPVETSRGFMLHTPDYRGTDTTQVSDLAALTTTPEILRDVAIGKGPKRSLFALGYAGWSPQQLEAELAAGAWVVIEADEALLFDHDNDTKWQRAFDRRGFEL